MCASNTAETHVPTDQMKIGLVTIGQAPRPDLLEPIQAKTGGEAELVLTGALDDLSLAEVSQIAPNTDDIPLVTRMRDGGTVTISHKGVVPLLQQRIDEHENAGVDLLVVLCTGSFPELTANVPMLMPDRVLNHFVTGAFPEGKLGIIAPAAEQEPMMRRKWHAYPDIVVDSLNPYADRDFEPRTSGLTDCKLIVLDCMGYTNATKTMVRSQFGAPVIVAQEVLASAVGLLV